MKKLAPYILLVFLASSPAKAASMCPYHWWLALVAATETAAAYFPDHRPRIRVVQLLATTGVVGFSMKKIYDAYKHDQEKSEEKTPEDNV